MSATDNKKRVLVVDDEFHIRSLCVRVLKAEGFDVDVAADGKIAESMLDKNKYDLGLFDIKIPVENGKQLFEFIKLKYPDFADKVIFMTGDVISGDTRLFLEKTGRAYLHKPFDPDSLRSIVRKMCLSLTKVV